MDDKAIVAPAFVRHLTGHALDDAVAVMLNQYSKKTDAYVVDIPMVSSTKCVLLAIKIMQYAFSGDVSSNWGGVS